MQRVGEDDALDRRVRDVALVPQRDVSRAPACRLPRSTRARPQSCSDFTGLRLCGIALEPFCAPSRNGSSTSRTSVRWRWRISSRERLDGRTHRRARVEQLGVPVAGDDLRGRHRREPERARTRSARPRDRCWSTCRPRPTACRPRSARRARSEPLAVAAHLHRPERELRAERGRLGVDAVGAPDHRRVAVLAGPGARSPSSSAAAASSTQIAAPGPAAATARCRRRRST